jgi:pyruvate/2-oxoglutarate dehydrogenase complex dihydrolipoamide acyltransferase (E2) component
MARLRVNLAQGEFEVEGDEDFVRAYAERIEALLERLGPAVAEGPPDPPPAAAPPPAVSPPAAVAPATADEPPFGEWLQGLPRNATDVDRMLLAGLHLQRRAADRAFTTADANRLLLEHGVKLGNPSQSVKQNLVAKRAFAVQRGRYRVARDGLGHLEQLTGRGLGES